MHVPLPKPIPVWVNQACFDGSHTLSSVWLSDFRVMGIDFYPKTHPTVAVLSQDGFAMFDVPLNAVCLTEDAFTDGVSSNDLAYGPMDQVFDLPESIDLSHYGQDVVIYDRDRQYKGQGTYILSFVWGEGNLLLSLITCEGRLWLVPPHKMRWGVGDMPLPSWAKNRLSPLMDPAPSAQMARAAGVFARYGGRILALKSTKRGSWGFPCGKIEPGETAEEAAVRECYEETGCDVRVVGPPYVGRVGNTGVEIFPVEIVSKDRSWDQPWKSEEGWASFVTPEALFEDSPYEEFNRKVVRALSRS
jgi:8-oxo-dGTP pyrophosphatase MutT (NUDIX family)